MVEKEIKRGYVKWEDDEGVMHKELLTDHPELLASANPKQQLAAEEARRMAEAGETEVAEDKAEEERVVVETLEALKSAPPEVLTGAQLPEDEQVEVTKPASGAEEPAANPNNTKPADSRPLNEHEMALQELRSKTS